MRSSFLSSCTNGGFTKTSGYFTYKINSKTDEVLLIGLSKEGQKQETIVIPSIIDGKKIGRIGHYLSNYGGGH